MLAEILGGSQATSVLGRHLSYDSKIATYTSAYYDGTSIDDATFGLMVMPAPDVSLADAEAELDKVLDDFLKNGPDPAALERIRTQVRAGEIYARDNVESLANRYGQELSVGLTMTDIESWDEALAAVTAEDVMAAARKVLDRKNAVTGWLTRPATEGEATP